MTRSSADAWVRGCALMLASGMLFIVCEGCGNSESAARDKAGRDFGKTDDAENATSFEVDKNTLTLEHDFGVLKPDDRVTHRFSIKNDTAARWTVRKVINMCACTATDLSKPTIEPGGEESITVEYPTVGSSSDETRKVVVLFEEPAAPRLFLVIHAKIREIMTIKPTKMAFWDVGRGQAAQGNFEVQNFGDSDWQSITLKPSADWIDATPAEISFDREKDMPRQMWRVGLTVGSAALSCGDHQAEVVVHDSDGKIFHSVPVFVRITSPVVALPAQLFFGRVKTGQSTEQTIKIRFASTDTQTKPSEIEFEHGLGSQLQFQWLKSEGEMWELKATLTPTEVVDLSEAKVVLKFANPTLPELELPIYATVSQPEEP